MALEVTFSSPPFFIYFFPPLLNLCTSLWLQCSHAAAKETKSHKGVEIKRLLEVIRNAKLLALQARTPSCVALLLFFLSLCSCLVACFSLSPLFGPSYSRWCRSQRRWDGESEPRYGCSNPGTGSRMCLEAFNEVVMKPQQHKTSPQLPRSITISHPSILNLPVYISVQCRLSYERDELPDAGCVTSVFLSRPH